MKDSDLPALKEAAQQWVHDNEDSIEVFDCYVSFDDVPEEIKEGSEDWIEDAKNWAEGAGEDARIGFVIQKITAENGAEGFVFIEVKGHSWEGLRIFIGNIFETEADARKWVEEIGVVI